MDIDSRNCNLRVASLDLIGFLSPGWELEGNLGSLRREEDEDQS